MQPTKGTKTRQILVVLAVLAAICVGCYYFLVVKKEEDKPSITQQEETSVNDSTIKKLTDTYQAATNWESDSKFTIQLEKKLIAEKPVLFEEAYIEDVFRSDDKNIIRFSIPYFYENSYILELECSQEIIDRILLEQKDDDFYPYGGYAVVANITEVSRQLPIEMSGSVYLNEDDLSIDVESTNAFVLKGSCIDAAYLEGD
jgi:hypothetical protein